VISKADLLGFMNAVNLKIEEKRIPAVLENLQRIELVAQAVNAVELGAEEEIGPEWRP
jgi:hypothetical protein